MNDRPDPEQTDPQHPDPEHPVDDPGATPTDEEDTVLAAAGARLRRHVAPIPPSGIERAIQRRRLRRMGGVAAASVVVALLGGVLIGVQAADDGEGGGRPGSTPSGEEVDRLVASLDDEPVDPTEVQLVGSVSTFPDCGALIADLRRVGAEHVGSRGFGAFGGGFEAVGLELQQRQASTMPPRPPKAQGAPGARRWGPTCRSSGWTSSTW